MRWFRSLPGMSAIGIRQANPASQPERAEPAIPGEVRVRDLSRTDWKAIVIRAGKEAMADNLPLLASGLAYSSFLAIPATLLVVVGAFTLFASAQSINNLLASFHGVVPGGTLDLVRGSLHQIDQHPHTGILMVVIGLVLALWSTTGAMTGYITAINIAYDHVDKRSFLRKRLVALELVACFTFAFLLVAGLLIFGPILSSWLDRTMHAHGTVIWIWWVAQWPILLGGLLASFAAMLYLAPDVRTPRWQFVTPGSLVAAIIWLAASGLFAVYTSAFSSYNKTWGSLSAVIVMLTWLWLTALALLLGAEVNAEAERSRQLRERHNEG